MDGEEKSLDDFFAKKDKGKKGKSKTKGKFTTSSSITKQVENSQKTVNEKSKEQKPSTSQTLNSKVRIEIYMLTEKRKLQRSSEKYY